MFCCNPNNLYGTRCILAFVYHYNDVLGRSSNIFPCIRNNFLDKLHTAYHLGLGKFRKMGDMLNIYKWNCILIYTPANVFREITCNPHFQKYLEDMLHNTCSGTCRGDDHSLCNNQDDPNTLHSLVDKVYKFCAENLKLNWFVLHYEQLNI